MLVDRPRNANGLYVVYDSRTKWDRECAEEQGGTPVFADWQFGKRALGTAAWASVTRIALFDYLEDVSAKDKGAMRAELRSFLKAEKPRMTLLVPPRSSSSRDKEMQVGENKGSKGHQGWIAAKAPGAFADCVGAVFEAPWGPTMGITNPINADFAQGGLIRRHMMGAYAYASGRLQILRPKTEDLGFIPDRKALNILKQIAALVAKQQPVAVDIETVPSTKQITAIAVACGPYTVSVPWDEFKVAGGTSVEPAGPESHKSQLLSVLASDAPKVWHNGYDFDIPFLRKAGFALGGPQHDTIALCGAITNQWRKGLQHAVAAEFLVPAWKSMHHNAEYSKNSDEAWTSNPPHLREYNALDAWYDLRLFEAQKFKCGLTDLYDEVYFG